MLEKAAPAKVYFNTVNIPVVFFKEKISAMKIAGISLGLGGAILCILAQKSDDLASDALRSRFTQPHQIKKHETIDAQGSQEKKEYFFFPGGNFGLDKHPDDPESNGGKHAPEGNSRKGTDPYGKQIFNAFIFNPLKVLETTILRLASTFLFFIIRGLFFIPVQQKRETEVRRKKDDKVRSGKQITII